LEQEESKLDILASQIRIDLVFVNTFLVALMPPQGFQQPGFKFIIVHSPGYTEVL